MAGSSTWGATGVYGVKGTGAANNTPGARELSSGWTDKNGDFWLFGGSIDSPGVGVASVGNDLWRYSVPSQEWTWIGGSSSGNQAGIYGTKGVASASNIPGAREAATSWTDCSGSFWLFGGIAYDSTGGYATDINDLWKFNPAEGTWTWVSGSNLNAFNTVEKGIYGVQGAPGAANLPGARGGASGWADSSGNLWLFGGYGFDSSGNFGAMNDLWEFTPAMNTWTWVSGSSTMFATGNYGVQGVTAATNVPQARERASHWIDGSGNLWLFGGIGWTATEAGMLNDLWRYNPTTNMWTWMTGSSTFDAGGVGIEGIPAAGNTPGARERAASWSDKGGNLWLYGGEMLGGGILSDLWEFNPSTNMWTWVGGSTVSGNAGVYGTQGIASVSNTPGARSDAVSWTDNAGDLWLFGGRQQDSNGDGMLNDLWRYQP
jgi:N-acetylneuraminic acid mutarotase